MITGRGVLPPNRPSERKKADETLAAQAAKAICRKVKLHKPNKMVEAFFLIKVKSFISTMIKNMLQRTPNYLKRRSYKLRKELLRSIMASTS